MSRFLDHIVSAARTELASALRPPRGVPAPLAAAEPAEDSDAPEHPAVAAQPEGDDTPRARVAAPRTAFTVAAAVAPAAPPRCDPPRDAAPSRSAAPLAPAAAPDRPSPTRHAGVLAGAWIESPQARRPRTPDRSLVALAPTAPEPARVARVPEPAAPSKPAAAPARPAAPTARPSPAVTPRIAERGVAPAASRTRDPLHPPAAPRPPAPARELLIDQLDVRIIAEPPPPRAPTPSPAIPRTPSSLGAWRPSARRFLRQP
jgi:D-alanyl-D-alanine carboxypeptidase (penicillin-binding protein 5/6)